MLKKKISSLIGFFLILGVFAILSFEKPASVLARLKSTHDRTIWGRVISEYGPVENARVRVAGTETFVLTDRQGNFELSTERLTGKKFWVTAGKEGWFNNAQVAPPSGRMNDIFLYPIYLNDRPDYRFISPVTCSRCHVKLTRYWDKSKMAHTTSNPKVLDIYYGRDALQQKNVAPGYRLDNPDSEGNCVVCHAPSVAASRPWTKDLETALLSARTEWDGISCDYCHKVRNVISDKTRPSGKRPVMERQTAAKGSSIMVLGPYDDVVVPPMGASYSSIYDKGRFCSTCHGHFKQLEKGKTWDHSKVYSASEWKGFGLKEDAILPIQTTYREWEHWQNQLSPKDPNKGKKCQDCHMSWRKEMLPYDNYVVDDNARNMWGTYRLPKNIRPHHFDGGTKIQLKTALSMELDGKINGNKLDINVYITNTNGGHWVPTGETMRSVMLVIDAVDSNNKPLKMIKGERLPEWTGKGKVEAGNYAGLSGAVFARVLKDDNGNLNVPFWRATAIAADTRIRPKTTVTLSYEFVLKDPEDEPTVEAKLIYRPVIRSLAKSKKWTVEDILITSNVW
jgi:hypothetical protein